MSNSLTIGILTHNNETTIERTLASIKDSYDILIVDSGSSDKTLELAQKYGARVLFNKFKNFADQRNFLLSNAKSEFVFFLDSDEAITDSLLNYLKSQFFSSSLKSNIFRVARTEYLDGKEIESGYGRSGYQSRILRERE